MEHIGWRLEVCRVSDKRCTFVTYWDRGWTSPFEDDGTWRRGRKRFIVQQWDSSPTKKLEVVSITKVFGERLDPNRNTLDKI